MALYDQLGFESPLVLAKLGHDLRERLDEKLDTPVPDGFEPLIERIADSEQPSDVLTLKSSDYAVVEDGPLA